MSELVSAPGLPNEGVTTPKAGQGNPASLTAYTGLAALGHVLFPNYRWGMEITYVWNAGIVQIPLAGLNAINNNNVTTLNQRQPCKVVQLHAPAGSKVVSWSASRVGAIPVLPHPLSSDPNLTLYSSIIKTAAPPLETDLLTHEYVVSGIYVYIMTQPVWVPTDGQTMGATGYDITPAAANTIPAGAFVQGAF